MDTEFAVPNKEVKKVKRTGQLISFLGPAFIVSVAYIDPGNFATNISGGSLFNYNLLWVIFWSNIIAVFLQSMSAKLGIATGYSLPEMCGKAFSRKVNWILWIFAEFAAMATDLAEFLGGTLGLYLLFEYSYGLCRTSYWLFNLFNSLYRKVWPKGNRNNNNNFNWSYLYCIFFRTSTCKTRLEGHRNTYNYSNDA